MILRITTMSRTLVAILSIAAFGTPIRLEAWDHPRVAIAAEVESSILLRHLGATDRKQLLQYIEHLIAEEAAKNFPCMEWLSRPSAQIASRAELRPTLIDYPSGSRSRIFLSYNALLGGKRVNLGTTFDQELLGVEDYPGDPDILRSRLNERIRIQLQSDNFRRWFNAAFIEKVRIADSIHVDARNSRLMIPVTASRLSLDLRSPLIFRLKGALCTSNPEPCSASLENAGEYETGSWTGALRASFKKVSCCPRMQWESFASQLRSAREFEIFIGRNHKHCEYAPSFCLDGGLAMYPGRK